MRAISLFSGVGGLDLGFQRAGIETVLQAEQDPWCLEVLARHWPQTERVTDVRDVGNRGLSGEAIGRAGSRDGDRERDDVHASSERTRARSIDLVYGGFPCQDVSVAGKRAGLGGERSGLWFEFHRVLRELRPRWAVIENVPGLLSSNQGRDFAVILDGLDELGFDVAWAVLDAQHFGVPQRRRRVFVVAGPSRRSVEQVLSLCEGCGGNPETGGTAGQDPAVASPLGAHESGGYRDDLDHSTYVTANAISASAGHHGHSSPRGDGTDNLVASTLRGRSSSTGVNMPGRGGEEAYGDNLVPTLAWALQERDAKGPDSDTKVGHLLPQTGGVRRLTPLECDRLMGWPEDWTRWTADGREISDSHRYRLCGNGVVAPVAEWIGHRLVTVDALMQGRGLSS